MTITEMKHNRYSDIGIWSAQALHMPGVMRSGSRQMQISVWKPGETSCQLYLYKDGKTYKKYTMHNLKKIGVEDVFYISLELDVPLEQMNGMEYDFMASGKHFVDPYARCVSGREHFGRRNNRIRGQFCFSEFDWSGENWHHMEVRDMILYQAQVRSFTRHSSSGVSNPGTFDGMREKIPYLKKLGINTLFLLPIYEFDEWMKDENGQELERINCWGYNADAFYFAPKRSFSSAKNARNELKQLVKELHQAGMNLLLDFYFTGQTPSFILQCLKYYVLEFHIDGFRINQDCMDTSWLQDDPVLSHTVIIGNDWSGHSMKGNVLEMNDGFLVDARRFLKSDEGQVRNFYYRFKEQKRTAGVIHYIACNNGFTLRDMISYDVKHNEANGERNQDGTQYNYSWNCGFEGPTRRKSVLTMRRKQEKNALVMLLLGMGAPLLLAGDEFGRTQKGNNNAYCLDNATTWVDWRLLDKNRSTFEFVQKLIAFRKEHPLYHQKELLMGLDGKGLGAPDVSCHGREPWVADFSYYSRELGVLFGGGYYGGQSLYFVFNFHWDAHDFYLPAINGTKEWKLLLDTSTDQAGAKEQGSYRMAPRSIAVFEECEKRNTGKKNAEKKKTQKNRMPVKKQTSGR